MSSSSFTAARAGLCAALAMAAACASAIPETVYFPSADGRTELVGYVFTPASAAATHPAVVMLHGRGGPYSSNVNAGCTRVARGVESACTAGTLSKRHEQWGEFWAARGYVAVQVDSFGPRGKGHGFGRGTHGDADREDVNEVTVRPLDAEGAAAYLHTRADVGGSPLFVQGWSNGGSTTLNVMQRQAASASAPANAFSAALAFYPGCGRAALISQRFDTPVALMAFVGSNDEEVSPTVCRSVLERATARGAPVELIWYDGATHDFDDPGKARQSVEANRRARDDSMQRAAAFFGAASSPAKR
jgi:dienelactone hydrolase